MAYESKPLRRQKIRYNNVNDDLPISYQFVNKGAKVTPTSATIAIYKPSSTTAVQAATAMTASGTLLTYLLDTTASTTNYAVATGYRAHIIITASSKTYEDDLIFDIVKYVPQSKITRDSLLAIDDRILGMSHAGDEDFSEVIEACRDEVELDLETHATEGGQLLVDMILDSSRVDIPMRFLVLSRIFRSKGEGEIADYYQGEYRTKMRQVLSGIKYDQGQSLVEGGETIKNVLRLVY